MRRLVFSMLAALILGGCAVCYHPDLDPRAQEGMLQRWVSDNTPVPATEVASAPVRSADALCPVHKARLRQLFVLVRSVGEEPKGPEAPEAWPGYLEAARIMFPLADFDHLVESSCWGKPTEYPVFVREWCCVKCVKAMNAWLVANNPERVLPFYRPS